MNKTLTIAGLIIVVREVTLVFLITTPAREIRDQSRSALRKDPYFLEDSISHFRYSKSRSLVGLMPSQSL